MKTRLITLLACAVMAQELVGQADPRGNWMDFDVSKKEDQPLGYGGKRGDFISVSHFGARLQWSTNSIDWVFFNLAKCKSIHGCGELSGGNWAFGFTYHFQVGNPIDKQWIGDIDWDLGWVGPDITKFSIRLYPKDVLFHKENHKNSRIRCSLVNKGLGKDIVDYYRKGWGARICEIQDPCKNTRKCRKATKSENHRSFMSYQSLEMEWDYGVLQVAKSLNGANTKWEDKGWYSTHYSVRPQTWLGSQWVEGLCIVDYGYGNKLGSPTAFFRLKPIDEDASRIFEIDLENNFFRIKPND